MIYTYVIMEVSQAVYDEIKKKMIEAGYVNVVIDNDGAIDMHGIAINVETKNEPQ